MTAVTEQQPDPSRIIACLADELQLPVEDVAKLYAHERAELASGAQIDKFIDIFVIRNVQQILRQRTAENPQCVAGGRAVAAR